MGISIPADFRPMGYKLSCCGSLWSKIYSRTLDVTSFCDDYLAQKALPVLLFQNYFISNFFLRYWNQLNEDMRILLQRFDAETGDEEEKNEESDSTTSFLTQLATWHKQELDEKLASRVQVSQRAVGKIIQVKLCKNQFTLR